MALFTSLPTINLNAGEFKEVILMPGLRNHPMLSTFLTVTDGMKAGKNVGMFGRLSKISKKDAGCGSTPSTATIPFTSKVWDPTGIEMWIKQCYTELQDTFLEWGLALGYEQPLAPSLALRMELRGYVTLINSSGGFFCSGGCVVSLKGDALVQGEALLGLSLRF